MNVPNQSSPSPGPDAERQREAERILRRVDRDGELFPTTGIGRVATKGRDHFGAADKTDADRVEIWATRTGRVLGLIFFIALVAWLVSYVL